MSRYLKPEHPSYSTKQAWFVYAVTSHRGPGFCRLILVEAPNHAAVSFLERVSCDGGVSPTCHLMTVHRGADVGIRSDLAEEISFSDFANDMVDRQLVDRDALAREAYAEAVSPPRALPPRPKKAEPTARGNVYQGVLAALGELGYKRGQAEAMMESLGNVEGRPLADVLKAALQASRAA